MAKKILLSILIVGLLGLAGVAGFVVTRVAQAAAPSDPIVASFDFGRGGPGGVSDENLASALGITVEKLKAAYQTAYEEALKQAVSAGKLTQEQADKMKERGQMAKGGRLPVVGSNYHELLAKALGISVDQLNAAYQKAFLAGIDQAVADGKLTQEQADAMKARQALATSSKFQTAMRSAFEAAVKQAVADGLITQAQADKILSAVPDRGVGGFGVPGMKGFDRGMRPGGFDKMPFGNNRMPIKPGRQATPTP